MFRYILMCVTITGWEGQTEVEGERRGRERVDEGGNVEEEARKERRGYE